jgi:hypothetical protein
MGLRLAGVLAGAVPATLPPLPARLSRARRSSPHPPPSRPPTSLPRRAGKLAALAGQGRVFLMAATLRPETMYGQTNCWVLPEGQYGAYRGLEGEVYIMTERSATNLSYQVGGRAGARRAAAGWDTLGFAGLGSAGLGSPRRGTACSVGALRRCRRLSTARLPPVPLQERTPVRGQPECLLEMTGQDLIGTPVRSPHCPHERVYVLPLLTILTNKGTGACARPAARRTPHAPARCRTNPQRPASPRLTRTARHLLAYLPWASSPPPFRPPGVVTSVPSDSPDDYTALQDLVKKPKLREKYGVADQWVLPFQVRQGRRAWARGGWRRGGPLLLVPGQLVVVPGQLVVVREVDGCWGWGWGCGLGVATGPSWEERELGAAL